MCESWSQPGASNDVMQGTISPWHSWPLAGRRLVWLYWHFDAVLRPVLPLTWPAWPKSAPGGKIGGPGALTKMLCMQERTWCLVEKSN